MVAQHARQCSRPFGHANKNPNTQLTFGPVNPGIRCHRPTGPRGCRSSRRRASPADSQECTPRMAPAPIPTSPSATLFVTGLCSWQDAIPLLCMALWSSRAAWSPHTERNPLRTHENLVCRGNTMRIGLSGGAGGTWTATMAVSGLSSPRLGRFIARRLGREAQEGIERVTRRTMRVRPTRGNPSAFIEKEEKWCYVDTVG